MSANLLGSALDALMFLSLCVLILSGLPVVFVLAAVRSPSPLSVRSWACSTRSFSAPSPNGSSAP